MRVLLSFREFNRSQLKVLFLLATFCIMVLLYQTQIDQFNLNWTPPLPPSSSLVDSEITEILSKTPYLWRKSNRPYNISMLERLQDQREWIKRISNTQFIRNAKPKRILVRDGIDNYYRTEGKLNCHYAPQFEDKCIIQTPSYPWSWTFRKLLKLAYKDIDAEVVVRNWEENSTPPIPGYVTQIMYILEPPLVLASAAIGINNALIGSYMRESDIPVAYHEWFPSSKGGIGAQESNYSSIDLQEKRKLVAAMVSNCDGLNRIRYIQELQKYISVDVYGKCGDGSLSCPRSQNEECLQRIGKEYKFYLAFENSNCEDYITEKYFRNALQHGLLPIVMGARYQDYVSAGPPNSFIHVDEFSSPKDLADYLHYLDKNDDKYLDYFKWRGTGSIESSSFEDFFCRVCGMLYYAHFIPKPNWNDPKLDYKDVIQCLPQGKGSYRWDHL